MKSIALLSDTHGYLDEAILSYCEKADEIWHAGDFGNVGVANTLMEIKPVMGVYGNIDGGVLRKMFLLENKFYCEEVLVFMVHIGGYPGNYSPGIGAKVMAFQPSLFISGHSHILKVMRDQKLNQMLHINPGAAGKQGFQKVRTMVTFKIEGKRIFDLQVIELGVK